MLAAACAIGCSRSALEIDWAEWPAGVVRQDAGAQPPPHPFMDAGVPSLDATVPLPEAGVTRPDAGMDAAFTEPPTIELISPLEQRSFYVGDLLRLEAACSAQAPAVVVESFWREGIANPSEQVLNDAGSIRFTFECTDSAGQTSRLELVIEVSDAPHLVYGRDDLVFARRLDRFDTEVPLLDASTQLQYTHIEAVHYARDGEVVIAQTARVGETPAKVFAIYRSPHTVFELAPASLGGFEAIEQLLISPTGRDVLIRGVESTPVVWRLEAGGPMLLSASRALQDHARFDAAFSPDGRYLLFPDVELQLLDLDSGDDPVVLFREPSTGDDSEPLRAAMFSSDGQRIAYMYAITSPNDAERYETRVITVSDALAGEHGTLLQSASGWIAPAGASSQAVLATYADGTLGTSLGAFGFDGELIEGDATAQVAAVCGDVVLEMRADRSLHLRRATSGGLEQFDVDVDVDAITDFYGFSEDCAAVGMTLDDEDGVYVDVPALGAGGDATVHRIADQPLERLFSTDAGTFAQTLIPGRYREHGLYRDAVAAVGNPVYGELIEVASEGATYAALEATGRDPRADDAALFLTHRRVAAPNEGLVTINRLFSSAGPIAISPDGKYLAVAHRPSLNGAGDVWGEDGLLEITVSDPASAARTFTTELILSEPAAEGIASVFKVPGRRAVLMTQSGPIPNAQQIFARALFDGAQTLPQTPGSFANAYRDELLISPSGNVIASHQHALGNEELSITALRLESSAPRETSTVSSLDNHEIIGFGATEDRLITLERDWQDATRAVALHRLQPSTGEEHAIVGPLDAPWRLGMWRVIEGTGVVFFTVCREDGEDCQLFVDHPTAGGALEISDPDRALWLAEPAPSGEWAVIRYEDSDQLELIDNRHAWGTRASATIIELSPVGPLDESPLLTFFDNEARGEGVLITEQQAFEVSIQIMRRDDASVHPLASRGSVGRVALSPDHTLAVLLRRRVSGDSFVASLDLTRDDALPIAHEVHGYDYVGPISSDNRFAIAATLEGTAVVLDLRREAVLELGPRVVHASFDRLSRYLAYIVRYPTAQQIQVRTLEQLTAEPFTVDLDAAGALFWADD